VQLDHENRIQTLERRITDDYPWTWSTLLGDIEEGGVTVSGPGSFNFGWAFGQPCSDPGGCDEGFYTDDTYVYLPAGYAGQYEVTMQASLGSGTMANVFQPVTPGDITPTNDCRIGFVPYVAENGVVDLSTFIVGAVYQLNAQEPPQRNGAGYIRVFSNVRVNAPNSYLLNHLERRWALRPFLFLPSGVGPVTITGLVFSIKLMPPESNWSAGQWSG
jgi:hypothetical protein